MLRGDRFKYPGPYVLIAMTTQPGFAVYEAVDTAVPEGDDEMELFAVAPTYQKVEKVNHARGMRRRERGQRRRKRLLVPFKTYDALPEAATHEQVLDMIRANNDLYPSRYL